MATTTNGKRKTISPLLAASASRKKPKSVTHRSNAASIKAFLNSNAPVRNQQYTKEKTPYEEVTAYVRPGRHDQPLTAVQETNMAVESAEQQRNQTPNRNRNFIQSTSDMVAWYAEALRDQGIREQLKSIFDVPREQIEENTSRIEELEDEVTRLTLALDNQEQYGRRNALRIYNPNWTEEDEEDTDSKILGLIRNNLHVEDFPEWLISRSHRVGKRQSGRIRPILVKFTTYRAREKVMKARKYMPTGGYINEDLTQATSRLAYQARELKRARQIADTWTYDVRVYAKLKPSSRGFAVKTLEDLLERVTTGVMESDDIDQHHHHSSYSRTPHQQRRLYEETAPARSLTRQQHIQPEIIARARPLPSPRASALSPIVLDTFSEHHWSR